MSEFPGFTPLVQSLPATVPFVGSETQERATGKLFGARLGANESGFGPAPKKCGNTAIRKTTSCARRWRRISAWLPKTS